MEYSRLGRSALKVSRLCLGTMNFGPSTTESDSFKIMDRALELGINFFDTADVYGWKKGEGLTERIIGRWLDQGHRPHGRGTRHPRDRNLVRDAHRRRREGSRESLRSQALMAVTPPRPSRS